MVVQEVKVAGIIITQDKQEQAVQEEYWEVPVAVAVVIMEAMAHQQL